jgi:hypothetical protein
MTLTADGNLGIGTSSPTSKLTVAGAISVNTGAANLNALGLLSGSSGNRIGLSLGRTAQEAYIGIASTSNSIINGDVAGDLDILTTTGNIRFSTNAGASLQATLDSSGNLAVGTTTTSLAKITAATASANSTGLRLDNGSSTNNNYVSIDFGLQGLPITSGYSCFIRGYNVANANYTSYLTFGTNGNSASAPSERMRIDGDGNLLVGKTSSADSVVGSMIRGTGYITSTWAESTNATTTYHLYSTGAGDYRFYVGLGGTIFATSTTISAISDIRYKENVRDLNVGLAEVLALKPRLYDWKEGKGANIKNARGFIAQEFETVFPDLIDEWKDPAPEGETPYKSVRQDLIPVLVKAMQEQQAIIESLKARLDAANL